MDLTQYELPETYVSVNALFSLLWKRFSLFCRDFEAELRREELRGLKVLPHHGAWVTKASHSYGYSIWGIGLAYQLIYDSLWM